MESIAGNKTAKRVYNQVMMLSFPTAALTVLPAARAGDLYGHFDLPSGGTPYVSARSGDGGPSLPGEWHGFLGGKTPRPVVVDTERVVEGIDFVVRKME